ncbi:FliM/FliN family flagellar motor switch protein [Aliiroseovarius sp. M344]|uniref:FliM/FliN family flagellar motor switch protein n=1 Tax=Aliiroseovarius sp. M344 TaxID=2867010 RepID=UPI0021AE1076|nr:flagellar motor switch protein FliM [Aliiroseovarius sp. M344]UWQ15321.1 FliM/FliN family flagellar motor switch protein [Aliiroseovarius sp. M344]
MAEPDKISAIRQKAEARHPPPEIPPATAARALRAALARAGEATAGLVLTADEVSEDRVVLSALDGQFSDSDLLALIEGPESRFGLLVADPNLIAGLIEMQTIGRVLPAPAPLRAATRTDAAMCADFIDTVLEALEAELSAAQLPIAALTSGFRFAVRLVDYRAATMLLPDIPYRRFQTKLELGGGGKRGALSLLLPFAAASQHWQADGKAISASKQEAPAIIMGARAELNAVLHRVHMALDELTALTPGMTLNVPRDALCNVALEDMAGQALTACRLGQAKGQRALRIGQEKPGDVMATQATETSQKGDTGPGLPMDAERSPNAIEQPALTAEQPVADPAPI